jgi:opacity protein-like surface antigen
MKRQRLLTAFLFCLAIPLISQGLFLLYVKVPQANVRAEPDLKSPVIARLKLGTLLESSRRSGDFFEVALVDDQGQSRSGFIHSSLVEVSENSQRIYGTKKIPAEDISSSFWPDDKEFGISGTGGLALSSDYGAGFQVGAGLSYLFNRHFSLDFSALWYQTRNKGEVEDFEKLSKGTVRSLPLQLGLTGRIYLAEKISPFLTAGVGFHLNGFALDSELRQGWENLGFQIREKVKNSAGVFFGGGLDYFLSETLSVGLNFKYFLSKARGTWSLSEVEDGGDEVTGELKSLNLSVLAAAVGIRYLF